MSIVGEPGVGKSRLVLELQRALAGRRSIYVEGRWGARIEDIVVCTATGGDRLNRSSRDLRVVA